MAQPKRGPKRLHIQLICFAFEKVLGSRYSGSIRGISDLTKEKKKKEGRGKELSVVATPCPLYFGTMPQERIMTQSPCFLQMHYLFNTNINYVWLFGCHTISKLVID